VNLSLTVRCLQMPADIAMWNEFPALFLVSFPVHSGAALDSEGFIDSMECRSVGC
jgi:hypothetical protein